MADSQNQYNIKKISFESAIKLAMISLSENLGLAQRTQHR